MLQKKKSCYQHSFVHSSADKQQQTEREVVKWEEMADYQRRELQIWAAKLRVRQCNSLKFQRIRNISLTASSRHSTQSSATKVEPFNFKAVWKSKWTHLSLKASETWQVLYRREELSPGAGCGVLLRRGRNYRRERKIFNSIYDWENQRLFPLKIRREIRRVVGVGIFISRSKSSEQYRLFMWEKIAPTNQPIFSTEGREKS